MTQSSNERGVSEHMPPKDQGPASLEVERTVRQAIVDWLASEAAKPHPYSDAAVDELVECLSGRDDGSDEHSTCLPMDGTPMSAADPRKWQPLDRGELAAIECDIGNFGRLSDLVEVRRFLVLRLLAEIYRRAPSQEGASDTEEQDKPSSVCTTPPPDRDRVLEEAAVKADERVARYRRLAAGDYSDATKDAMQLLADEFFEHAAELRSLKSSSPCGEGEKK